MCDIWCLEAPALEGPSDLRFFHSQEAAVLASGLSFLSFEVDDHNALVAYSDRYHYLLFYIWKVVIEDV